MITSSDPACPRNVTANVSAPLNSWRLNSTASRERATLSLLFSLPQIYLHALRIACIYIYTCRAFTARNRERIVSSSFGIDRKIGSRDSSCGSHPPLLFASGSRYTFDSCNRGIRGRAIALRLLAPSRATPWKTNSGQIDRWICRSTIDSRVDCPTRFPDHVPFFPPSSFRLGRRTSETEKLVSSCVHRRIRLPRGSSSPLLHTVGGRREPIRAENKSSNIRGDFDFPSLSPCLDNISKRKRKRENRE